MNRATNLIAAMFIVFAASTYVQSDVKADGNKRASKQRNADKKSGKRSSGKKSAAKSSQRGGRSQSHRRNNKSTRNQFQASSTSNSKKGGNQQRRKSANRRSNRGSTQHAGRRETNTGSKLHAGAQSNLRAIEKIEIATPDGGITPRKEEPVVQAAIQDARCRGALPIFAAGNQGITRRREEFGDPIGNYNFKEKGSASGSKIGHKRQQPNGVTIDLVRVPPNGIK